MRILIILLILLCLINTSISIPGVLQLDSSSFDKAKNQFSKLVVYFYSNQCSFCSQFQISYLTAAVKMQSNTLYSDIQFAKISFQSQNAAKIFQEFRIDAVPALKILIDGVDSKAVFSELIYDELSVSKMETFISRAIDPGFFRELESVDEDKEQCVFGKCHQIIVKCSDRVLIDVLISSNLYYQLLDVQMCCTSASQSLQNNELIFKNKEIQKKFSKCSQNSVSGSKISENCRNFILNMRHYWIEPWNSNHVSQIFENQQMVFVLLHGNQSSSRQYLRQFVQVKRKLNDHEKFYKQLLPIFTNADKDDDRQDFLKIKKFVGGYRSNGEEYPLPMLVCLKLDSSNQFLTKILYQPRFPSFQKSQLTMQQWISGILTSSINSPYYRNYHFKEQILQNEDSQMQTIEQLILASALDNRIYLTNLNTLIKWFSLFKNPQIYQDFIRDDLLFVLYTCKTDFNLSVFVYNLRKQFGEKKKNTQFIYIDYLENDMPPGVSAKQFPVLLVYQKDKLLEKHEGIMDVQQVEKVLEKVLKSNKKKQIL